MALKAIGFHLMKTPAAEGMFGKQPKAEEQIGAMVEKAFVSRVLQPATAQLKIDEITREAVPLQNRGMRLAAAVALPTTATTVTTATPYTFLKKRHF